MCPLKARKGLDLCDCVSPLPCIFRWNASHTGGPSPSPPPPISVRWVVQARVCEAMREWRLVATRVVIHVFKTPLDCNNFDSNDVKAAFVAVDETSMSVTTTITVT